MAGLPEFDISDEMVRLARESSLIFSNVDYQTTSAEQLPFEDGEFTHAFSMESLYYYANIGTALKEIYRMLRSGGIFVTVLDLYLESRASHQWVEQLKVPVQLLGIADYRSLFTDAGFVNCAISAFSIRGQSPMITPAARSRAVRITKNTDGQAR